MAARKSWLAISGLENRKRVTRKEPLYYIPVEKKK